MAGTGLLSSPAKENDLQENLFLWLGFKFSKKTLNC
jgi:hypothetical protein